MNDDEELLAVFQAEVGEQLGQIDEVLAQPAARWDIEKLFHLAHNIKGAARMTGIGGVSVAAHALEDLFGAVRGGRAVDERVVRCARDGGILLQACFDAAFSGHTAPDPGPLRTTIAELIDEPEPTVASDDEAQRGEEPNKIHDAAGHDTVRVSLAKVQGLMALASELWISLSRIEVLHEGARSLAERAEELRRDHSALAHDARFRELALGSRELVRGLAEDRTRSAQLAERIQDAIRRLRMVRVGSLRGHLGRVARGAGASCGREVLFELEGDDTEIDRAILDALRDPLMHLVRNAVAHGIEPADERTARGKRPQGRVTVRARAAGSWVEITVQDDGRGVDLERVRAMAESRGMVSADGASSREELLELVFRPGFSTSEVVSELAGRGFGMDIARTNLAELGGLVELRSEDGAGTEVLLRAPLTRLTTRVLLVRGGGHELAIPMLAVERTLLVTRADLRVVDGADVVLVGSELVPISALATALSLEDAPRDRRPAFVLHDGHRRRAFLVEEVLGERDLTIHALPWSLASVPAIAGAALDGLEIVLVLDAPQLLGTRSERALDRSVSRSDAIRKRRVLVVDDSVTSRTLEKNILTAAGYEVLTAVDGAAALELLRETKVDLVVTDVDMPRLSGIELARRVRATRELARLPLILVTSLGDEADRRRGAEAGADAYIVKGEFDQDDLLRAVARLT